MASTVFLHVGVAKTGTSFLQRILWTNRDAFRSAGLLYPGKRSGDQFVASLDLRDLRIEKYAHLDLDGMWDRLAAEVRSFPGSAVISHETLARCSGAEIRRVQQSLAPAELRVVVTARDLGRQIPAVWQETIKNRATNRYSDFLSDIFVNADSGEHKFFWRPQDVARVVRRWGRTVGISNVTVVTVPQPGAPRDELWRRFSAAISAPAVDLQVPESTGNVSLGAAEAELLRYVNLSLPDDLPWPRYARVVKRQFAEHKLARRSSDRIGIPSEWHPAVQDRAARMIGSLKSSGCQVVGDLGDLEPVLPTAGVTTPEELTLDELLGAAAAVIRDDVVLRGGHRRVEVATSANLSERIRAAASGVRRRVRRGS
jgi:hypothetical protein